MQKFLNKSIVFFLFFICTNGYSQLFAPYANFSDTTNYTISGVNDSIFFFAPNNDSTYILADTHLYNGYSLEWAEFQSPTGYKPLTFSGTKLFVDAAADKGYKLTLRNGTDSVVQRCWVLQNKFSISITPKNNEQQLSTGSYIGCDLIEPIWIDIESGSIPYYNPSTLVELNYRITYKISWNRQYDVEEGKITTSKIPINGLIKSKISNPYWKDMWYTAKVTDASMQEQRDSVFVRSIRPHADFTAKHIPLDDEIYYPDKDSAYYYYYSEKYRGTELNSAPALFFFENKSENADSYTWDFGDAIKAETTADSIIHNYTFWGKYKPKLVAQHEVEWALLTCEDSLTAEEDIDILEPKLSANNFMSIPYGDNNVFRIADVSILNFEISIFNRNGLRVHHYEGEFRDWDGWDGKYNKSDNYVPTGVYYYIAKGYSVIKPFDPKAEPGATWQAEESATPTDNTGTDNNTNTSNTGGKDVGKNTQYRGFFHVFNNE